MVPFAAEAAAPPGRHWSWSCYAPSVPGRISAPRGVANTGGEAGQGSRKRVLALARMWGDALLLVGLERLGNLMPFAGLKIDHIGVARRTLLFHRATDRRRKQPPAGRQEQQRTDDVGNKARQDQENPTDRGGKAGGLEVNGADSLGAERAAQAI